MRMVKRKKYSYIHYKSERIPYTQEYYRCPETGYETTDPEMDEKNLERVEQAYKKAVRTKNR